MNIGFIGLGHMGLPMVGNLIKAGFNVTAYDIFKPAMTHAEKEGATPAHTLQEALVTADVIITMLQTGQQVSDTCLGDDGIFTYAKKNLLYLDCSSIDITTSRTLHKKAKQANIAMLDAPVSGGVAGALNATLTFMVGGEKRYFQRAKPILEKLGKKIIYAGPAGNGQAAKICNNILLGISMIGVCEAFSLGEKLGLDAKTFFEISSNASGQCWSMTSYCPVPGIIDNVPSNNHYQPGFMAKMMLKDLRLGEEAAASVSAYIPLGEKAADLYAQYVDQGNGEVDFSGIIQWISLK